MENCLVTKLKANVDNNNLAVLNTIFLDYVACASSIGLGDSTRYIRIGASGGDVKVTFKVPMHRTYSYGGTVTKDTIADGTERNYYIDVDVPDTPELVKVENIYNLSKLIGVQGFDFSVSTRKGLESLKYCDNLVSYGAFNTPTNVTPSVYGIAFAGNQEDTLNLDLSYMPNLQCVFVSRMNGDNAPKIKLPVNNDHVMYINARLVGHTDELPANLKCLDAISLELTGGLEDFVTKARTYGRTSGWLKIKYPKGQYGVYWGITYNGTALVSLDDSTMPVINNYAYLAWTADTISFASEAPEGSNALPISINSALPVNL